MLKFTKIMTNTPLKSHCTVFFYVQWPFSLVTIQHFHERKQLVKSTKTNSTFRPQLLYISAQTLQLPLLWRLLLVNKSRSLQLPLRWLFPPAQLGQIFFGTFLNSYSIKVSFPRSFLINHRGVGRVVKRQIPR